ncbi:MAG: hypothetical protein JSV80_10455 [Acidobacteriota bacterium]|nr:MAG: hypothetical protein JSV80_10455 [Acidobacteriota bacterium]
MLRGLGIAALVSLLVAPAWAQGSAQTLLVWESAIYGLEELSLRWPVALAMRSEDEIVVVDAYDDKLVVFTNDTGGWIGRRKVALPASPASAAYAGGRYFVSLRGERHGELISFDPDRWAQRPVPLPRGVVAGALAGGKDGTLAVHDQAGSEVLILDAKGSVRAKIPLAGPVHALTVAPGGALYAASPQLARVVRVGEDGAIEQEFDVPGMSPERAWPVSVAVDTGGELYVVDRHAGRVVVLDAAGALSGFGSREGWDEGLLRHPAALALTPGGRVVIADQGNGRVQVFLRARKDSSS